MRAIFISYRREDSEEATRLRDDLVRHFGEQAVCMDVGRTAPGREPGALEARVASCAALVALIGKSWLEARNGAGQHRLDEPGDPVRVQTACALKRDIPVVPVLVHGARLPLVTQLPDELAELAFRDALPLTPARRDSDVAALVQTLSRYVAPSGVGSDGRLSAFGGRRRTLQLGAALAMAVLAGGGFAYAVKQDGRDLRKAVVHLEGSTGAPPAVAAPPLTQAAAALEAEITTTEPSAAIDSVSARPSTPPQAQAALPRTPEVTLVSWWSSAQGDHLLTSEPPWVGRTDVRQGSYAFSNDEGRVFDPAQPQPPGTVPLVSWRGERRKGHATQDYRTTSSPRWRVSRSKEAGKPKGGRVREGYRLYRLEGYVYDPAAPQPPDTRPLFSWYDAESGDYFTTTQPRWCMPLEKRKIRCEGAPSKGSSREGYEFVRLEGFVR